MNNLNDYIDICIGSNGSHYDVSKVIYELIKDKFNYCGKNVWKYIENGENTIDDKQLKLKNVLKSTVINTFIIRSNYWDDKAIVQNDINIALDYQIKSSTLLQIANKLKDDKYLNCIIKELKQFFNNIIDD
jgi:hypothetical protein|uniref:Uncharacterized protein n=1 Tax=viral metagenome TaxID=1070528 RepID=A0A6C0LF49_9ZZZZ